MRPRRSLLYVPGNEEKKVRKAASLPADVVVLDCEDGVAISMKVRIFCYEYTNQDNKVIAPYLNAF